MIRRVWRCMSALSANTLPAGPCHRSALCPLHCPACTHVSTLGLAGADACNSLLYLCSR